MYEELTRIENESIRSFVQKAADEGYLSGRVLDFGCGRQPYRDIVERLATSTYTGFDRPWFPGYMQGAPTLGPAPDEVWDIDWNAIICTQVVQYLPLYRYGTDPQDPERPSLQGVLTSMKYSLEIGGHLVLTYPTNWPEVQPDDLHRFTKAGMERLLIEADFEILVHERRAAIDHFSYRDGRGSDISRDEFALGYGVIARA
jgi:hypothetical protein